MEIAPINRNISVEKHDSNRQISIWLDNYEDIFSDFDPRPYADRSISDDFIAEVKKVSHEDDFAVDEMNLLVPDKSRKPEVENIITKRLHSFFRKNYAYIVKRARRNRGKGILLFISGIIMMLVASYVSSNIRHNFYTNLLVIVFEPAAWFFIWTGMDTLFFLTRRMKDELNFYVKTAKTKVNFNSY